MYIFVDLVKPCVITLAGEIQRYRMLSDYQNTRKAKRTVSSSAKRV